MLERTYWCWEHKRIGCTHCINHDVTLADNKPLTNCTQPNGDVLACREVGCGKVFYEIPQRKHHATTQHLISPTCTTPGALQLICTICPFIIYNEVIPSTGVHVYTYNVCLLDEKCGKIDTDSPDHFQHYMYRKGKFANHISTNYSSGHLGIDIFTGVTWGVWKFPIYAQGQGTVLNVNDGIIEPISNTMGWYAVIQYNVNGSNLTVRYLHLYEPSELTVGQTITQEDIVGLTGNSAAETTSSGHLHFDVNTISPPSWNGLLFNDNNTINPRTLFPQAPNNVFAN